MRKENFAAIFRLLPPLCHNTKKVVSDEFSDPGVGATKTAESNVAHFITHEEETPLISGRGIRSPKSRDF